jgi:hypothetical protein
MRESRNSKPEDFAGGAAGADEEAEGNWRYQ